MNIEHLSYSTCKRIYRRGVDYALGVKLNLIVEPSSKQADIGNLVHAELLENKLEYVMSPYKDFRTKEAREWRDSQTLPILTDSEAQQVTAVCDAVRAHPLADKLIGETEHEQQLTASINGIDFLGYADGISKDRKIIFDLKTTSQFDQFKWTAFKNDYDLQASIYRLFGDQPEFYFVVAETIHPFRVQIFGTSSEFLENGDNKLDQTLQAFREFRERPGDNDLERISFNVGATDDLSNVEQLGDWSK